MKLISFVLTIFLSTPFVFAERVDRFKHQQLITLTDGVVGGIESPIVRQEIILYRSALGKYQVWLRKLEECRRYYTYSFADYSPSQFDELVSNLSELKKLPLENPVGGEDIYQQDISLGVFTDQWQWMNQAPGGCVRMKSKTTPTTKQKEKFQEMVHQVHVELKKLNFKETDRESYVKTFQETLKFTTNYRIKK